MYRNTQWLDEVKDIDTGELIQEGTDQSAGHFNNMEHGISDAHLAAALLVIQSSLTADQVFFQIGREGHHVAAVPLFACCLVVCVQQVLPRVYSLQKGGPVCCFHVLAPLLSK